MVMMVAMVVLVLSHKSCRVEMIFCVVFFSDISIRLFSLPGCEKNLCLFDLADEKLNCFAVEFLLDF